MNALKGEFTANLGGKEWKFKTGTNQTAIFESVTNVSLVEYANIFADTSKLQLGHIRALLYSALLAAKNEITLLEVGDLMDETSETELQAVLQNIGKSQSLGETKKK